jgi:hypothetical protein
MASIYVYTDDLINDQVERLGEDLLRLQSSMIGWVSEGFNDGASVLRSKLQTTQDLYVDQQFQVLTSLIGNADTTLEMDKSLIQSFSGGEFGIYSEAGEVSYAGDISDDIIQEAYVQFRNSGHSKGIKRIDLRQTSAMLDEEAQFAAYFYNVEKLNGTIFKVLRVRPEQTFSGSKDSALDDYLKKLYETRGFESYIVSRSGKVLNAYDASQIGRPLARTDFKTGISLFQRMTDNPDSRIQLLLDEPYEAFTTTLENGYLLLMTPSKRLVGSGRAGIFLGYALILFNLFVVTATVIFLRKNHAFAIEKISLTELQVQNRRRAAGFIVIVIVVAFALMILLINGLLNIQLAQLDFDLELRHFSDNMAVQYSEAYESLEDQTMAFNQSIENDEASHLTGMYVSLRGIAAESIRKYPATTNSSAYIVSWLKVMPATRDLLVSQYNVDINQFSGYRLITPEGGNKPMTLIGFDLKKSIVWVIQRFETEPLNTDPKVALTLPESGLSVEGFFAHYRLETPESVPVLLSTLPVTDLVIKRAGALGLEIYNNDVKDIIGKKQLNNENLIVFALTSEPLGADLKRVSYGYTRSMSYATLILLLITFIGWWHYGRKGPTY